jgi:hypothetical protein
MSNVRSGSPGATRVCPHCKATVLESAAICPGCRHHLRFSSSGRAFEAGEGYSALSFDGTIAHTQASEPCEYCVVLDVRNERGEQLARQVVGVGVLQSGEIRRLNMSVEMMPVRVPQQPAKTAANAAVNTSANRQAPPLKPPAYNAASASTAVPNSGQRPAPPGSLGSAGKPGASQQAATLSSSTAANASMQRLGVIRRPR